MSRPQEASSPPLEVVIIMSTKEVSNFYFFRCDKELHLLVGTANLPSEPTPVWEKADIFGRRGTDYSATQRKEQRVKDRFLSKNNVFRCDHLNDEINLDDYTWDGWFDFKRIINPKTTSTTPLFIGKKKTGVGSYFFHGQNLFLAESKEDVINHVKQEDSQSNPNNSGRERIPDDTQIFVWNRDGGSCVKCGSQENLAFDHIIPHSLGGSNSRRNLQLLCDPCNLKKSNKIGG